MEEENRQKSLVSLVVEEYSRLKKIEPSHEALTYLSEVESDAIVYNRNKWDEYVEKFQNDSDVKTNSFDSSCALKNYYVFLKKTSDKLEKEPERLKKYLSRRHSSK